MTDSILKPDKQLIKKIGRRIYALRQSKGMSGEDLAFKLGISHQQLYKYEHGINRITFDRLISIASVLDFKLSNFFPASEFGNKIGSLSAPQNMKEIRLMVNFAKFRKLSSEDLAVKFISLLTDH